MAAIITKDTRVHNAKQFVEAVGETANTTLYTFIGKPTAWANESAPDTPTDTFKSQIDIWENMTALKKVSDGDISLVIPRNAWKTGNVYYQFNDSVASNTLFDAQMVVINSNYQVYKCLSNNYGGASSVEPQGTGFVANNIIKHDLISQDGYIWKYMYTITTPQWAKFGTSTFMPVSDDSTVTTNAANARGIYAYKLTNTSTSLSTGNHYLRIDGDGTGANANITVSSGVITALRVNDYGSAYSFANIKVTTAGTSLGSAVIDPICAPAEGHGNSSIEELGGVYAMINTRLEPTDAPEIPVSGFKFRQVGLLKDPYLYGTTTIPSAPSTYTKLTAYSNVTIGSIQNTGSLLAGATIRNSTNTANATVVSYSGSVINYIKTRNSSSNVAANYTPFTNGDVLYVDNAQIGTITAMGNATVRLRSGEIIYIDNRNVITRASDQVEDLHIVLEF